MANRSDRTFDVQPSLLVDDDLARGRSGGRKVPVPMLPSEVIRIETAVFWAKVVDKTIRDWVKRDGIGRQADKHSPLHISFPALLMKMDGQLGTIERLRVGDRDHPAVAFYLERAINLHRAHIDEMSRSKQRRNLPLA